MSINLRKVIACALLTICSAFVSPARAQQSLGPRAKSVALVNYGGDLAALLAHLPHTFGPTIGLEVDPQKPNSYIVINVREATLTDVLNAIVKSEPRYGWREIDGSIAISPVAGANPLLDITIKSFRVAEVDEAEAINRLMDLPEVQSNMRAMSLTRGARARPRRIRAKRFL